MKIDGRLFLMIGAATVLALCIGLGILQADVADKPVTLWQRLANGVTVLKNVAGSTIVSISPRGVVTSVNGTLSSGSMTYPGAGVPQSNGTAWTASLVLDTNGTMSANSDSRIPSQKAVKTYAGTKADLVGGKVPSTQLPSYVDDVLEYGNSTALPPTGEAGKIYVTIDDNLEYRWSGSVYAQISKSLALGNSSLTAYRGDRGETAYNHSQLMSGNPHAVSKTDVGLGNVTNVGQMPISYLDTNGTLAANSDTKVASQKAVRTYAAPLVSPSFSGTPTAPTAAAGANSTQIASVAFVANSLGYFRQVVKSANATLTCSEIANTEITVNGTTTPVALTIPRGCGGSWGRPSFVVNNARTGAYATRIRDTGTNASIRLASSNATKGTTTAGWGASVSGNQIACKESRDGPGTVRGRAE